MTWNVGGYDDLISSHPTLEENDFTRKGGVIDRDINRTYPNHEDYEECGMGQDTLKRVLLAFADHDKEVRNLLRLKM